MHKTRTREEKFPITVDIDGLAAMLSCGHSTARKIAEEANARVEIGRRVLYSVDKVRDYIAQIAD